MKIDSVTYGDARREHINNNRETLERQAASFYTGIIKGIDQRSTSK